MIELFFVACLSTAPADCEERSLLYTNISPMTCLMRAQPELAKWAEMHPRWTISRWNCRHVDLSEQEA